MSGSTGVRSLSNYSRLPDGDTDSTSRSDRTQTLFWNNRDCTGSDLHLAALSGNVTGVEAWLATHKHVASAVSERLTYETIFAGKSQEGSAEAIHVAASRGHVDVVQALLAAKASLSAMVTRDHKDHFDVLHAATFAEGRGGSEEMIKYLMDAKAEMTKNLDGRYPIHIAYQTGNVPVITFLRKYLADAGVSDKDYLDKDGKVPLPLSLGISGGKMSEVQLSQSAELTTLSLTTLIKECPQCIPHFMNRLKEAQNINAQDLARSLSRLDIASVLSHSPEAAIALMESATDVPSCANKGWHPLPTRVSFANRDWLEKLRSCFNPPRQYFTFFEKEHHWSFDSAKFEAPKWHDVLTNRGFGRPIVDAEIRVCHIPDLLCAEVFASLCDEMNAESDVLFDDPVVESMIAHVFWNGCCRTELTWVMLTIWGLALIIAEEYYVRHFEDELIAIDEHVSERLLRKAGGGGAGAGSPMNSGQEFRWLKINLDEVPASNVWVSICWIASKAVVDLLLELFQARGFNAIGRWRDYFALDNLRDVVVSILPMLLFVDQGYVPLTIIAVLMYWTRTLDCFVCAEYIGNELLPIKNLTRGMMPALFVTTIAFCAFTHAFYLVNGSEGTLYPDVFLESFTTLITAGLPADPSEVTSLKLILVLAAVVFFSVFILNIFISVISEGYVEQRDKVAFSFKKLRAASCFCYLLRCRVLPCRVCSKLISYAAIVTACSVAVGVQMYCFYNHRYHRWVAPVFFVCQLATILASYQDPDTPWVVHAHGPEEDHYMWFCRQRSEPPEEAAPQKSQEVADLRKAVDGMKVEIKTVLKQFDEVKTVLRDLRDAKK